MYEKANNFGPRICGYARSAYYNSEQSILPACSLNEEIVKT